MQPSDDGLVDNVWIKIWQFRGPIRASITLWMLLHGGLPTIEFLWKRGIMDSPLCRWCERGTQSTLHLLHDCPFAMRVWNSNQVFFGNANVYDWVHDNLSSTDVSAYFGHFWPFVFTYIVHDLWFNHNAKNHRTIYFLEDPYTLAKKSLFKVFELLLTWTSLSFCKYH